MRKLVVLILIGLGLILVVTPVVALTKAQLRYAGRFVYTVDNPTAIWYIDPQTKERWAAETVSNIQTLLQRRATTISLTNLKRIPAVGSNSLGDLTYRRKLAGRLLVDTKSRYWYVSVRAKRRGLIGSGSAAIKFMQNQAVQISAKDLAAIPMPLNLLLNRGNVATDRGTFVVERLSFNWTDQSIRVVTDTANDTDCGTNCPVISLGAYVARRNAVAGINGTYFCPQDYAACREKINSFGTPVWNTFTKSWRNGDRIKYTAEPLVALDTTNRPFLYSETRDFTSAADFANNFYRDSKAAGGSGVLQAAISNGPVLMKNNVLVLKSTQMDWKQANVRSARGGFGWQDNRMVFFVAHGATVTDLAAVAKALGLTNAVNIDGGGSTALHMNGRYVLGPGRNLPNAILITHR